jgi:hypothetical protein
MLRPICEDLTTRKSLQPDYLEIGTLSADGQIFRPVSVVGKGLSREAQLYFVAAEGNCTIRGQDRVGQMAAAPMPLMAPAEPVATTAPAPVADITETEPGMIAPDWAAWGLAGVVVIGAIASAITARRTKANDQTPDENYSVKIGGRDGH